jgi:DNA-binding IclR family transcriptional regulator
MLRRKSARGASITTALRAVALLRSEPRRPTDLAAELRCSPATVKRLLVAIREAGEPLTVDRRGREAWSSLASSPTRRE